MDVSPMDSPLVGQTPSQILGFHLCRSAKSAEATVCGMGVWEFHPPILQMDTDWEVEWLPRGVSLFCFSDFGWGHVIPSRGVQARTVFAG